MFVIVLIVNVYAHNDNQQRLTNLCFYTVNARKVHATLVQFTTPCDTNF